MKAILQLFGTLESRPAGAICGFSTSRSQPNVVSAQFVHISTQLRMARMHRSRGTGQLRSPSLPTTGASAAACISIYLQRSCLGAVPDPKQPQSGHHQDRQGTSGSHTLPTQNGEHTFSMYVCQLQRHGIGTLTNPKSATTKLPHGPTTATYSL